MSPLDESAEDTMPVSLEGSITASEIQEEDNRPILAVSVYATWQHPVRPLRRNIIVQDASAHRLISDLSMLIGDEADHRIIVSGDWNLLYGYAENGVEYWARRYRGVFDRMADLGLVFVGPQHPNGIQADPWPDELPTDSLNVPTLRTTGHKKIRQLDYVFASESIADNVRVTALNSPEEWGSSDHCRVLIEVKED